MNKLLTILIVFLFAPLVASSQEIVLVMRSGNYMPYQYFPDNEEPRGLYIDLVKEAGKQLGISVNIKKYPWKRCQKYVMYGDVDGIIGIFKKRELLHHLHFAEEPLAYEEIAFFTLKTNNIHYNGDVASLYPLTVGVTFGSSFGQTWEEHSSNFTKLDYSPTLDSMVKKLVAKRSPLMLCDKMSFEYFSKKNNMVINLSRERQEPLDQIIALHPSIGLNAGFLAFTKAKNSDRNKKMSDDFAKAIKAIKESDLFIEILDKYADF